MGINATMAVVSRIVSREFAPSPFPGPSSPPINHLRSSCVRKFCGWVHPGSYWCLGRTRAGFSRTDCVAFIRGREPLQSRSQATEDPIGGSLGSGNVPWIPPGSRLRKFLAGWESFRCACPPAIVKTLHNSTPKKREEQNLLPFFRCIVVMHFAQSSRFSPSRFLVDIEPCNQPSASIFLHSLMADLAAVEVLDGAWFQ